MKKSFRLVLLFLFALLYLPISTTAQDFEGIIHYEISNMEYSGGTEEMPYMVKGSKARMEFGQGQQKGAMIVMPEESKMVILVDAMKGYMTMDTEQTEEEMEEYSDTEVTKTGETKQISGRQCEVWRIHSSENTIETCMAKGMGTFMTPQDPTGQDNIPQWVKKFMDEGAMPLEVIEITNGDRKLQMKAVKIEEKTLSSDLFEIPEGYRDVTSMMNQMRNRN